MRTLPGRTGRTTTLSALASATAVAAVVSLAAPASAAAIGVRDADDTRHGSDLRSVVVRHTDRAVVVTTTHDDLRRDPASGSGGAVYLDTDPADRGPEFVFVGGYFVGTDYQLVRTEGFGPDQWGMPVDGSYEMTVDYAKDQVRMRMSRAALGRPDEVRVAVRASGPSESTVDWLRQPRSSTPWVARG